MQFARNVFVSQCQELRIRTMRIFFFRQKGRTPPPPPSSPKVPIRLDKLFHIFPTFLNFKLIKEEFHKTRACMSPTQGRLVELRVDPKGF